MTPKQKFNLCLIAWLVNAVLFLIAWFGGDALLIYSENFKDSVDAMRATLSMTKVCLSMALFICVIELKKEEE